MKRSIQGFRAMAAITALASGAAWAALGAQADTRPTLAVMSFSNGALGTAQTELAPLSAGIQDLLIDQLSGNAKVRVVERGNLQSLMNEQNLSATGRVDAAMLYSRALAAKDAGHNDEAVQLLQKSLAAFPDFAPAQNELKKLQSTGGTE